MDMSDAGPVSETLSAVQILGFLSDRIASLTRALPVDLETTKMLHELGATTLPPTGPPVDFLEELRREVAAASKAKRLSDLSGRQRRYAAWLLWSGDEPAAGLPGVLEMVLAEARSSRGSLRRFIQAFLRDFDSRAPGIGEAAQCIQQALRDSDDPRVEHWRLAQKEVQLFEPMTGPRELAATLIRENEPGTALSRYRLDDPIFAASGYMLAAEDAVRADVPMMLRDGGIRALERIVKILAPGPDLLLRFPFRQAETARAFLGAWFTDRGEPAPALQEPVRRFLLSWIGDPRLNQQRWFEVGQRETALMRRWLARVSLDLFFRLIDRQHSSGIHWPYRRAFWFAYLEKGAISDAWLALGTEAYSSAAAIRELGRAYGRLIGERKQSALLLRIGPLVISEFTNVGKVRAWPAGWSGAPQLGRQEYSKYELTGRCLPFPPNPYRGRGGSPDGTGLSHFNSHENYWQGSAAALIERHTGIKIAAMDWHPR